MKLVKTAITAAVSTATIVAITACGSSSSNSTSFVTKCLPLSVSVPFGGMAFKTDGDLLIADGYNGNVLLIDHTTCAESNATVITAQTAVAVVQDSGDGTVYVGDGAGNVYSIDNNGTATVLVAVGSSINGLRMAPATFGSYAGQLFAATQSGVYAIDQSAVSPTPVQLSTTACSDIIFDGSTTLYAAAPGESKIYTVEANGTVADFNTTVGYVDGLEISDDKSTLYLANSGTDELSSFEIATKTLTKIADVNFDGGYWPSGLVNDHNGFLLMHTGDDNNITAQPLN